MIHASRNRSHDKLNQDTSLSFILSHQPNVGNITPKRNRTELSCASGKKRYTIRDAQRKFENIQSYQCSHAMDILRVSQS